MTENAPQKPQAIEIKIPNKQQTARIAIEDAVQSNSPFDPSRTTSSLAPGALPQTIRLKKPATAPLFVKPPTSTITPAHRMVADIKSNTTVLRELPRDADLAKRETSRIILRDVGPVSTPAEVKHTTAPITGIPVSATGIPQTIRLKRPPTSSLAAKPPDLTSAPTRARAAAAKPADARSKSQTSRMVLDDAIKASAAGDAHATTPITGVAAVQPQTIRLKRPSAALAVKAEAEAETDDGAKSKTAKIDLPPAVVDASTPASITQRKTIKIKRTERNVAPHTLVLKRSPQEPPPEAAPEAESDVSGAAAGEAAQEVAPPVLGWGFAVIAAAALLCVACLAYLMAAQAFGPELQLPVPSKFL